MTGRLADALAARPALIGAGCTIPSPLVAELIATTGYDYVNVDQQHGVIDNTTLLSMLQAIDSCSIPITRVPANDPAAIMRSLDFGAAAVIVPLVETAEEAARAVSACRYPPRGIRSYGPVRAQLTAGSGETGALEEVACLALVETRRGMDNLDAIAAVDGLDGIYVGPNDLALGLGVPRPARWPGSPDLLAALDAIRTACERHGIVAGIGVSSGAVAAECMRMGFRMVGVGYDATHLAAAFRAQLTNAQGG